MVRFGRCIFLILFAGALLAGTACGTSTDTGTSGTPTSTTSEAAATEPTPTTSPSSTHAVATPTPEPRPALSTNQIGLFLAIHGGSSSDLLRTVVTDSATGEMVGTKNITIDRDAKAVVLYLPDSEEVLVLDSYPTFPIWLNIPLSKSSAFFKPLSICETLAVGMAIITP